MSFWNIHLDFEKSHGSYVFDKNTDREYLDFFGMYSSVPLGYNHSIFDDSFRNRLCEISTVKVANCEFQSDVKEEFVQRFYDFAGVRRYNHYHFTCTGSLAVECAIKLAMDHTGKKKVVSLNNSFHGIHSYGNFTTSKFYPVKTRLEGYPDLNWPKIDTIDELILELEKGDVAAVLVEPIQATFGDNHLSKLFLREIAHHAKKHKVPLIFDEIQTGFGTTGKPWYFQHLNIRPDIVVFGKKSQVSGVMTTPNISFEKGSKLCVTFDGDIIDMLRSIYVMKAYEKYNLLENATQKGLLLKQKLSTLNQLHNVRGVGVLLAFDMENREMRDKLVDNVRNNGMICNPTGEKTIRLRPNLAITEEDCNSCFEILEKSIKEIL